MTDSPSKCDAVPTPDNTSVAKGNEMTNLTAPELKPCPFCGGIPTKDHWAKKYMECKSCGVYGPDCIWPDTAENAWNTRADIPAARTKGGEG